MTNTKKSSDMVKIKNLRIKPKSKKYIIETDYEADNEYVIDEDTIIKYGIFKDKEFEEKEFKKIIKDINVQNLYNKVLNYISYKVRSKKEIYIYINKLNNDNEFNKTDINEVIKKLETLGYIDDLLYANTMLDYYKQTKGKTYIINFLVTNGIDNAIIEEVMARYTYEEECENAYKVACKYVNTIRKYPLVKQQLLLKQKLMLAGFNIDSINACSSKINFVDESMGSLEKDILKQIKKYENKDISNYEKKNKIINSLMQKGYAYKDIIEKIKL